MGGGRKSRVSLGAQLVTGFLLLLASRHTALHDTLFGIFRLSRLIPAPSAVVGQLDMPHLFSIDPAPFSGYYM